MVACNATAVHHLWYVNYITPFPRNVSLGRLWVDTNVLALTSSYKKNENRKKKKAKWATTLKPSMAMLCTGQKINSG